MRIIRFRSSSADRIELAAVTETNDIYVLEYESITEIANEAEQREMTVLELLQGKLAKLRTYNGELEELDLKVPVEAPEVWAAGVTYKQSRDARNYESEDKAAKQTYYDKVYAAERPEIFFKSTAARTVGPADNVYLRRDSNWQIPEPELGLVLNQKGTIIGYTIGNDMSCRDIEGENPLYLPQAKMWKNSCSIGPAILLADAIEDPYAFQIICRIYRQDKKVFEGEANTSQLKRRFEELVEFLMRDNVVFAGTVLLTGTCIVPPNDFTLQPNDRIEIEISNIGTLINTVAVREREA